ncbi:MAG: cysteine--tRNA ligase [Thermoanaerobaculia bacterium]
MTFTVLNTLSRAREVLHPLEPGHVRLYTCGPTVYNRVHIGNLRTFLWEDLMGRVFRSRGLRVTQVMNLTDIDDKTIRGAIAEGLPLREFTRKHIDSFFEDLRTLNVVPASVYPRATDHIPEMVEIVEKLAARGHTYESDGSIWFRISTFPGYGKLSGIDLSTVRRGTRVADDEYEKEDVRDFAVWKAAKEGEPESALWTTRLGKGRPGWHLECSAMSMKYLGETFDIHTGAVDNIFPHHENEIAQSEGATGKPFARYWLHAEHLIVDGEKMAKSKGNFFTLPDLLARGHSARAIRYLLLSVPYRQKLNFTFDGLKAAASALERLDSLERRLAERAGAGTEKATRGGSPTGGFLGKVKEAESGVFAAFEDDFNTAAALGALFTFVGETNVDLEGGHLSPADATAASALLAQLAGNILGVLPSKKTPGAPEARSSADDAAIEARVAARQEARKRRDFKAADAIRDELAALGIVLEDTPHGVRWHRKA